MPFFGVPIRNGLPIGLGSVAGFGVQQFDPSQLFEGGTVAGAWYDPSDLSTMFDSSAGTTPVAMPGLGSAVSVGLMLDKSQGLVLGSELASGTWANGTSFPFDTFTASGTGFSGTKSAFGFSQAALPTAISVTTGKIYRVIAVVAQATDDEITIGMQDNSGGGGLGLTTSATFNTVTSSTTVVRYLRATSTGTAYLQFTNYGTAVTLNVTSVSVRELPGNHAIAFNNTTARPELRARVNLLTYSEEFDNGAWTTNNTSISTNAIIAPDGSTTGDTLTENSSTTSHSVNRAPSSIAFVSSTEYVLSAYAKNNGRRYLQLYWGGGGSGVFYGNFDLQNGIVGTTGFPSGAGSSVSSSITDVGGGWYRCVLTLKTRSDQTGSTSVLFALSNSASASSLPSYTGDGTSGIYIWGADLRFANIGANVPAYQRIADANTYDTSGFPLYLRFDGIDDSMYTPANLNLSGTDKVAVFAGVRKLSDVAAGALAELSANTSLNTGTFAAYAPGSAAANYVWRSYGTGIADVTATTFSAPITNVLTGIGNIGGDISQLRANGSVAGTNTGDQGTGNYGTYPLYIGARNNSSLWFNGHLHSLIIAGSAVSAGNISATEQWVAQRTGIVIP